jgi:RimJ/RimL family protein N-acetyltransferase
MIQITPDLVSDELRSMFHLGMPSGIRALAVLAGGNAGKILTDDPIRPHWGFAWEADDGTLYRGGEYSDAILNEAVSLLRQDGIVAIGYRDGDPDVDRFPPGPDAGAECLEFDRPIGSNDLSSYLRSLPEGYSVQRMDQRLLERSPRLEEKINRYGSLENFLGKGIAVCILHEGEIACEAIADMDILGAREVGIRTQEAYRRQGLATTACAHLIRLCEEAGSHTYWDCVKFNAGSVALAHRLGFQNERAYKLLAWFKPKEE